MAKLDIRKARQANLEAERKGAASEAAVQLGTTLEELQKPKPTIESEPVIKKKNGGGRKTTAKDQTHSVTIRITEAQSDKINEWVYLKKGTDRSDVVRQALDLLFGE